MAKRKASTARGKRTTSKGYGQFCPVAKAAEIFAERWTPLVLRELISGSCRFSDLQRGVPLMSPSLLSRRLRELEDAGLIEKHKGRGRGFEYGLTEAGEGLRDVIISLGEWGHRWTRSEVTRDDLDPGLLMWDVRRRVDLDSAPPPGTVVVFDIVGVPRAKRRYWLRFDRRDEVELCLKPPGHDVDLTVEADIRTLVDVWMGHVPLRSALKDGSLVLHGSRALVRGFASWFGLSVFAAGDA
ncbi:MAG: winged helix-turn-helix transcriptional regulator [Planctomycetota bacterium]|jgi:DNA-binding HxlR family transcriptional regulator